MEMEETRSLLQNPYGLLTILLCFTAAVLMMLFGRKRQLSLLASGLYCLLSSVLGLFLGRVLYCAVQAEFMFCDELGEFVGFAPFFDFSTGSVNVGGVLLGILLAAPLNRLFTKAKISHLLDAASLPALFLYSAMRFIEPLSGQGYGEMVENEALWFAPLCMVNSWGDWTLSVCFIEGLLTSILLIVLFCLQKKCRKPGTLSMYTLILFCALQVLPECLRCDEVLYVLIFARVTHIVLAVVMFAVLIAALICGKKHGLSNGVFVLETMLMLLGEGICIGTIFALDKTNLPDILVYLIMAADLILMSFLVCRRIHKEDTECTEG